MSLFQKIGFIAINILFWLTAAFIGYFFIWDLPPFKTEEGTILPTILWGNFYNAVVVYINAFLLYPFRKQIWIPYGLAVFLLLLGTALLEGFTDYYLVNSLGLKNELAEIFEGIPNDEIMYFAVAGWTIQNFFTHFAWFCLSFIIIFFFNSVKRKQVWETLEKEKSATELRFLKAQINPHFLFNGINSIYFLIDDKPDIAKSTLLKFSDLLRYQLYECQDDFIPLSKELTHIESYIEMEKIRRGEDAIIKLSLPEEIGSTQISPLLFTPFLENAFKYLSNFDKGKENQVLIDFRLTEEQLFFKIENTIDPSSPKSVKTRGIGIANVKKRLALLYPQQHQLDIFKQEGRFTVQLNLQLAKVKNAK